MLLVVSVAQFAAAIAASALLDGLTPGPLAVGVGLGQGTSIAQGLFIEMFTTAALTMSVLMLAAGEFYAESLSRSLSCASRIWILESLQRHLLTWNRETHVHTPSTTGFRSYPLGGHVVLYTVHWWSCQVSLNYRYL